MVLVIVIILAVALVVFGRCRSRNRPKAAESPAPAIQVGAEDVVVARQQPITAGPSLSGTLKAKEEATVRSEIAGSILETAIDEGRRVSRGAFLARIDPGALEQQRVSAQSSVSNAENALATAQKELSRQEAMSRAGIVARRDVDIARQNVSSARAAVSASRSQLSAAGEQAGKTRVVAPIDGIISLRSVSEGDVVQPGGAICTIVDLALLELEASVPSDQIGAVQIGQQVTFKITGMEGQAFRGKIARINPAVDPMTRQIEIFVEIPNPQGVLVSGLYAEGRVESSSTLGIVVPMEAVDRSGSATTVVRVRGRKVERIPVVVGVIDSKNDRIEIRSGVAQGDVLLVGASQQLTPGTTVDLAGGAASERLQ